MNTLSQSREDNKQNISLKELIKLFWESKIIIIIITALSACIAYAFGATPTYQATVRILPPNSSDLAEYNETLRIIDLDISGQGTQRILSPDKVYEILYTQVQSDVIKRKFFLENYAPNFNLKSEKDIERLTKKFDNSIKIITPKDSQAISLNINYEDPKQSAKWANEYIDLVIKSTHTELLKNIQSEIQAKKESIKSRIATLKKIERDISSLRIKRLQDALSIAKAMNLEDPLPGATVISLGNNPLHDSISNEDSYLRGTKSLQAEIEVLNSSKNQDAYITGLPKLLTQQALLQTLNDNPAFSVARIDTPARPPYEPIKPVKLLVIAIGVLLGLFLSASIVLLINAIRND